MKIKCCKAPNLKLTKKLALLLSGVLVAILAAGIILCSVLGFNNSIRNVKTVAVDVDYFTYYEKGAQVKDICNEEFSAAGLEVKDEQFAEKGGVSGFELVYVFDEDTSEETLRVVKQNIDNRLTEKLVVDGVEQPAIDEDKMVTVTTQDIQVVGTTAKDYVGRGLIALLIFAVVSLLYVWLRYKLFAALYVLGSNLLTMGLTTAIIALTRIPVMPSVAAAIAMSVLFSAVTSLMFFNKLRATQNEGNVADNTADVVASSIAWKETTVFAALMTFALLVMICVGRTAIAWFSLSAMIGVHVAAFISLTYLPVMFVPAKKLADKIAANKSTSYKGAKKGEKAKKSETESIVD
jgi:preprotein translocase subunit SecF